MNDEVDDDEIFNVDDNDVDDDFESEDVKERNWGTIHALCLLFFLKKTISFSLSLFLTVYLTLSLSLSLSQ